MAFVGAGSYGQVYKVREPAPLSRVLALKVLRLDQFTAKAQTSFFQEARRIASMHHPNILPVYNFGQLEQNARPYLVTEYAPQTILDLFRRDNGTRRLAFAEELVPYIQQIASALQYVHNNGLVHQDVKPGNLLIGRNGQILLADFGTTFYLGMQTHASLGEITGTAAYMPLEQWQGNPRRDSDQYALAICCYELLTGRTPFVHQRLEDMWHAHAGQQPPPPQQWNGRIPVEVSAVLQRALAKDYHQRYNSISEFAKSYTHAVEIALQRYVCQRCGQQNRSGAVRCSFCGATDDNRRCPYCETPVRFGQRCCTTCGRLVIPSAMVARSPLVGVTLRQGRYSIAHVLKQEEDSSVMVAIAIDEKQRGQRVVLKRWECCDSPLTQRAKEVAYYEHATESLARLRHPLVPRVLDRFAEGRHYYLVFSYIDGESIEERLLKFLRPIPEAEARGYMLAVLNILIALEQQKPIVRHYDITPANIIIERLRNRVHLTGFQVPPPPVSSGTRVVHGKRTTRKLIISPYLPIQDKPYDQRTCIYTLAASIHHAVTNVAPPHYPTYPPVRMLNPNISPEFELLLSRALAEEPHVRYQNYASLKQDLQRLM
ncbi:hypothetical protein KSX_30080 [Ktedonospora formicarum]|uniref:non-specific serine/threonine protein kinase n=2 Tax=Ktedonospora formicarum TaxID=2778364 RepID=A0A8J3MRA5_9CHLR|nr:hypothetical protein KSX_30080 [Ktedonospora formicarum]